MPRPAAAAAPARWQTRHRTVLRRYGIIAGPVIRATDAMLLIRTVLQPYGIAAVCSFREIPSRTTPSNEQRK
jgi:hypothetical protein